MEHLADKKSGASDARERAKALEAIQTGQEVMTATDTAKNASNLLKIKEIMSKKEVWMHNYQTGTKYELYRVPLKKQQFEGLKFKNVCMILY